MEILAVYNPQIIRFFISPSCAAFIVDVEQRHHVGVKGQGPGEEVTPQEAFWLKLSLRLGVHGQNS